MKLLLLGPPGAGKGVQGQRLAELLDVWHISAGDLLRQEVRRDTPLGREAASYMRRGDLVPDHLLSELMTPVVMEAVWTQGGYILDGYPRTIAQATAAVEIGMRPGATLDAVVYLYAPGSVLIWRLLERAARSVRGDDTLDMIRHRLQLYAETTEPLINYYRRQRGILLAVDADQPTEEVTSDIFTGLSDFSGLRLAR